MLATLCLSATLVLPLSLDAVEGRVQACNREVIAATLAYEAAGADLRVAAQRANPTLTLGASNVNPHAGLGSGTLREKTFDSSVRIEQLVERGGKAELRSAQSRALRDAARADLGEQLRLQRLAARSAFFDLAAAQERVRLQADFRSLAGDTATAARLRFEAGAVPRAESGRFRLDAARAANDLRQAEVDRQRARLELARLIGAEASAGALEVEVAWSDSAPQPPAQGDRPDVAGARRRVQAAEFALALARALATRDVTVGLQADRWPASDANVQGTGTSYGLTVSMPLHVRHSYDGEAARAMVDLEVARAGVERLVALSRAEAELAEQDWRAARERRERVEAEVLPAAREVSTAAEFAYAHGATGVLDLLDARRLLKTVELDQVLARAESAKAWARRAAAIENLQEPLR